MSFHKGFQLKVQIDFSKYKKIAKTFDEKFTVKVTFFIKPKYLPYAVVILLQFSYI